MTELTICLPDPLVEYLQDQVTRGEAISISSCLETLVEQARQTGAILPPDDHHQKIDEMLTTRGHL
ncbi:MAG: hypothetical protein JKY49_18915 [Cohaesibacteraceae bacterium]|nr:hypothetical protein [Cohaesibacteraceae bacterium]MBL4787480.1 hypothetical protein [Cohaesibacteraceae bacterium]